MSSEANIITWRNPDIRSKRCLGILKAHWRNREQPNDTNILNYAKQGLSAPQIAKVLNVSALTIFKYSSFKTKNILLKNGKERKKTQFKNGQRALYSQLRKKVKNEEICCENCGTIKHTQIHHKNKILYNSNYGILGNFNNN